MQKSKIKVGTSYAVVQAAADHAQPTEAVVVAFGQPRKVFGEYRSQIKNDGVLVRFPEPVVDESYASFTPISELSKNYTEAARAEKIKRAVTEAVVTTRCIVEEWEPFKARRDERR